MTPKITFIISAFNRPEALRLCLLSLQLQTETEWEAIITDNATNEDMRRRHWAIVYILDDPRISYRHTGMRNCYYAAEEVLSLARGEWLCFPSDDSYYTPMFAEKMIELGERDALDFVCCDFVWGRWGSWSYCDGGPQMCHIDKTTFIVRRNRMFPFPKKHLDASSDGWFAEECVVREFKIGRVVEILVVHN